MFLTAGKDLLRGGLNVLYGYTFYYLVCVRGTEAWAGQSPLFIADPQSASLTLRIEGPNQGVAK